MPVKSNLKKEREKLRIKVEDVINTINDIVYVFDLKGNMLVWNDAFKRFSGYTDKEIAKMKTYQFFNKTDFLKVGRAIKNAFKTGKGSVDTDFLAKDGKRIPMYFSGAVFRDKKGKILLCGSGKEITEQKDIFDALRKKEDDIQNFLEKIVPVLKNIAAGDLSKSLSLPKKESELKELIQVVNLVISDLRKFKQGFLEKEKDLRKANKICEDKVKTRTQELKKERDFSQKIIDTAQAIIVILDTNGNIVFYNNFLEKLSGKKLKNMKGESWFTNFLDKKEAPKIKKVFQKSLNEVRTQGYVNFIIGKNEEKKYIEWYDNLLKDDEGNVTGLLAVGYDISRRLQAEEKIKESEREFRAIFNGVAAGILMVNPKTRKIISANRAMTDITGYTTKDLLKMKIMQLHRKKDVPWIMKGFETEAKSGPTEKSLPVLRKDKKLIFCKINSTLEIINERQVVLASFIDVTAKEEAEKNLKEKLEEFEKLNKFMVGRELKMVELKNRTQKLQEILSKKI